MQDCCEWHDSTCKTHDTCCSSCPDYVIREQEARTMSAGDSDAGSHKT